MLRTPLNPRGKKARKWARVVRAWKQAHPPDHEGGYLCGICGKWVHESDMVLDHIEPRSSRPDIFEVWSNLQPTHSLCNSNKGSRRVKPLISDQEYELRKKLNL